MKRIPARNYVASYNPNKAHHRAWLQAVLDRLEELDPDALQDGSELRALWLAAVETKAPGGWEQLAIETVGWGSTVMPSGQPVRSGNQITKAQADELLNRQIRQQFGPAVARLVKHWESLPDGARAALVSFAFNCGVGALEDSTLRRRLNAGELPNVVAREELPRWNKDADGVNEGLVLRRAEEVALFTGEPVRRVQLQQPGQSGMVGPSKHPRLFGFKPGDFHLVMDDRAQTLQAFDYDGRPLWKVPALARGQGSDTTWEANGSDTPPGLYLCGKVYRDLDAAGYRPSETADRRSYGWFSIDLEGLEGQEGPGSRWGRDGIMIHGGGKACGWPGAWAPRQTLHPTLGCIRCHNVDLRDRLMPLIDKPGRVFVSVYQEVKRA
jgi:GH24 family phage-related lysozyme (muramidase)